MSVHSHMTIIVQVCMYVKGSTHPMSTLAHASANMIEYKCLFRACDSCEPIYSSSSMRASKNQASSG